MWCVFLFGWFFLRLASKISLKDTTHLPIKSERYFRLIGVKMMRCNASDSLHMCVVIMKNIFIQLDCVRHVI